MESTTLYDNTPNCSSCNTSAGMKDGKTENEDASYDISDITCPESNDNTAENSLLLCNCRDFDRVITGIILLTN
jgi:hypothetical protein